jgi:hypothetical protein
MVQTAQANETAVELGRSLHGRLVGQVFPPAYAKNHMHQIQALREAADPCGATVLSGRFWWFKRILAKFFRPFHVNQSRFNHLLTNQIAEIYDLALIQRPTDTSVIELLRAEVKPYVDRLRFELFMEAHGHGVNSGPGPAERARAHVALRAMGDDIRLHIGAAYGRHVGYLNLDDAPGPEVELHCPHDHLPVEPNSVTEIIVTHVVERHSFETVGRLLQYWTSLLRDGGRLIIDTIDAEAAAECWREGLTGDEEFAKCLYGNEVFDTTSRRSAFTPDLLCKYVVESGLVGATVVRRWQDADALLFAFRLEAHKPASRGAEIR